MEISLHLYSTVNCETVESHSFSGDVQWAIENFKVGMSVVLKINEQVHPFEVLMVEQHKGHMNCTIAYTQEVASQKTHH